MKDVDRIKSRNGDYIMINQRTTRFHWQDHRFGDRVCGCCNQLAMMKENRAKQLESIADALVSRLRSRGSIQETLTDDENEEGSNCKSKK